MGDVCGAWLLVAGPLYQGAVELDEPDVDREAIEGIKASAIRTAPGRPSPWWWLVPPVMYVLRRRWTRLFRQATFAQLNQAQREQLTSFRNKATGWFTVAAGALLLAAGGDLADRRAPPLAGLAVLVPGRGDARRSGAQHSSPDDQR